jgi:hypothetical protein
MKEPKLRIAFVDNEGKICPIDSGTNKEIAEGIQKLAYMLTKRF